MNNLLSYYYKKIEDLQKTVHVLEQENLQLESYLFELTSSKCSEEYKDIIKNKVFKTDARD